jgi:hypothetical protein
MPGSNPEIVASSSAGFNKPAATRDKSFLSLSRGASYVHQCPTGIDKGQACSVWCPHCSTRHKILVNDAAIVHEHAASTQPATEA